MTTALRTATDHPKDARTGLTLPLRTSLGSRALAEHRAMVAVELEVLAKKFDRFGWDRDTGSAAHDRLITDWMDALQDYPLDEVRAACKAAVLENPAKMPNEGHILLHIKAARKRFLSVNPPAPEPEPERKPVDRAAAAEILAQAGFTPKRMGGAA